MPRPFRRTMRLVGLLLACLPGLAATGCRDAAPRGAARSEPGDPRAVVRRMIEAYRGASTYRDAGFLSVKPAGGVALRAPFSVVFSRPDRLRLRAFQADVAVDRGALRAVVYDAGTANLDGQVVVRPLDGPLTTAEVYRDPLLCGQLSNGYAQFPPQLELLLGAAPFAELFQADVPVEMLASETLADRRCRRVAAEVPSGRFVFWIDEETHLLRRVEYPGGVDAAGAPLACVADFVGAEFDAEPSESAFVLDLPDGAIPVAAFTAPPPPLASELLGRRPATFSFLRADGAPLTQDDLLGAPAILVWVNEEPACEPAISAVAKGVAELPGELRAAGVVVRIASDGPPAADAAPRTADGGGPLQTVFDVSAQGRDVFRLERGVPAVVLLDADGVVQLVEFGNPRWGEDLPAALRRVAAGESLADELIASHRQADDEYRARLREARRAAEGSPLSR